MTSKEFIERAIEGGWEARMFKLLPVIKVTPLELFLCETNELNSTHISYPLPQIFLDPLAWQAVGKVEGWQLADYKEVRDIGDIKIAGYEWYVQMHAMIDALCEGKSIEDFLLTL